MTTTVCEDVPQEVCETVVEKACKTVQEQVCDNPNSPDIMKKWVNDRGDKFFVRNLIISQK